MAVKTYGNLVVDREKNKIIITQCEPHVAIKLKDVFRKVNITAVAPYSFENNNENAVDILWFIQRYPLKIKKEHLEYLEKTKKIYYLEQAHFERIMLPNYKPKQVALNGGEAARDYQLAAFELFMRVQRMLLADDIGLGKTLSSLLPLTRSISLPAAIVVQTHMPNQWKGQIERFLPLSVHLIKKTTVYNLPKADVYIFKYSQLAGWTNFFEKKFFKHVVFDEIQEVRSDSSAKHYGARQLSWNARTCIGLSATPIFNFGDEMWNIMHVIKKGCLGTGEEFLREWAVMRGNNKWKIKDPATLGTYLRDNRLMLRRTRKDVGRELPRMNKIITYVDTDHHKVKEFEQMARDLAMRVTTGSFNESGIAARELDMLARRITGISKAKSVAAYVRILVESGEKVLLGGWHRDVYEIWLEELADLNPVMYTGTESTKQKEESFNAFTSDRSNLLIMSLRSGAGLDGLQFHCSIVVNGELDWSPKVHEQFEGRIDRDGNPYPVMSIYPLSEEGSDPVIVNYLGLKQSQSHGILNPLEMPAEQYTDTSRFKELAQHYLNKKSTIHE